MNHTGLTRLTASRRRARWHGPNTRGQPRGRESFSAKTLAMWETRRPNKTPDPGEEEPVEEPLA